MKDALGDDLARVMAAVRARKTARPARCQHCAGEMVGYGQRRYCSGACRARAFRRRHKAPADG